jgi:hypothetical protein
MKGRHLSLLWVLLLATPAAAEAPLPATVDFNRDIRPILSDNCYQCHGPDRNKRKAGLRLDTRDGLFAGREGRVPIVPSKPGDSELLRRVTTTDAEERMPDPKSGKSLSGRQIAVIRRWIEQGAVWKGHWAYLKPVRPVVPAVDDTRFIRNDVDRFLLAKLRDAGLQPSPEADRVTQARRLWFDLTGLPPTPADVEAFSADPSGDAYEKLVDRLLASPAYGERMAVAWLDLVRYADSIGYHSDNPMSVAPYRDYVIRSFNANKPFDRFTLEQLAGDLLPGATLEQRVASAYNRLLQTTEEGGAQAKEYEAKYAADRVRNVSTVWLGTTMGCCQCHDHKFDPFTMRDFYSFAAFFADIQEAAVGRREAGIPVLDARQAATLRRASKRIGDLVGQATRPLALLAPLGAAWSEEIAQASAVPHTLVTVSGPPRTVRLLPRGNWMDDSGPIMAPAVPVSLGKVTAPSRATRLDLARWLVAADNPLTARVFVNRLWKLYLGQGLARPLDDLGSQGEAPLHAELLDWLAVEFQESGWDVKHLVRLLVTSGAYRESSQASPALKEADPYNRLFGRQTPWRLDAEFVRDQALAVSGLLSRQIGGPSVKPYQPPGYWAALNFPPREWQNDTGEKLYRRGLYAHWQRTFLHPSLLAFDAPTREECTVERPRSNIPQQALVLLNDPTYVEAARVLAERIVRTNADVREQVSWAFREVLLRPPTAEEMRILTDLYARHAHQYAADLTAARKLLAVGAHPAPADLDAAQLAAWTSVARALLNLHETITRP